MNLSGHLKYTYIHTIVSINLYPFSHLVKPAFPQVPPVFPLFKFSITMAFKNLSFIINIIIFS